MSERVKAIKAQRDKAIRRMQRAPLTSPHRARLARWAGCLEFAYLTALNAERAEYFMKEGG